MVVKAKFASCAVLLLCAAPGVFVQKESPAHKTENAKCVLESAVRVNHRLTGASCGTIICAHKGDKFTCVLVLSTGHMRDRTEPEIEVFYVDGKCLEKPIYAKGQVKLLVENNFNKGIDFCLIEATIETAGKIAHTPLAPADYTLKKGDKLLSVGCDMGIEPKLFTVTMDGYCEKRADLNAIGECQAGRSGGGLFTADGKYVVGVCWGGTLNGNKSIFTAHKTVIALMQQCGISE
jgi:hypothetical protein